MKKLILQNRKGQKIVGVLEKPEGEVKGTCVVQHGYGGFKEQEHVVSMKDAFLESGYITFNFDVTNSFNESDGKFEEATLGLHYEDLEDVVRWVQVQDWFQGSLALTGHSMGGYAVACYAENYPDQVSLLVPVAPVVSGKLSFEAQERFRPGELAEIKDKGFKEIISRSRAGVIKRITWESVEERLNHDLLPKAFRLVMPTLLIVGSLDESCPPDHIKQLFEAIPGENKKYELIEGAPHTFREKSDLEKLKIVISDFLSNHVR